MSYSGTRALDECDATDGMVNGRARRFDRARVASKLLSSRERVALPTKKAALGVDVVSKRVCLILGRLGGEATRNVFRGGGAAVRWPMWAGWPCLLTSAYAGYYLRAAREQELGRTGGP